MQIELDSQDYEIIKLLTGLKNTNSTYPPKLFAVRRQTYIRRVIEIEEAVEAKNTNNNGKSKNSSSKSAGVLEIILVVAILVETVYASYIYRDRIFEVIQSISAMP